MIEMLIIPNVEFPMQKEEAFSTNPQLLPLPRWGGIMSELLQNWLNNEAPLWSYFGRPVKLENSEKAWEIDFTTDSKRNKWENQKIWMKRSNPKSARDTTSVFFLRKVRVYFLNIIYINPIHKWLIYETWEVLETWWSHHSFGSNVETETAMDAGGPFDQCLQLWKGAQLSRWEKTSEDVFHGVVGDRAKRWLFFLAFLMVTSSM